jgi:hypothetical protein
MTNTLDSESSFHFSSSPTQPSSKVAPIIVSGAVFIGKAVAGGAIGGAASWATTRILNNKFPQSVRKL